MAEAPTSTCAPWSDPSDTDCGPCATYDGVDEALLLAKHQQASDILFHLTGRRWPGICTDTILPPCSERCGCRARCGVSAVRLPGYPVVSVTEVQIDGDVIDPARYTVHDRRWLVYLPADGVERRAWPTTNDLDAPLGDEGTWAITYEFGQAPPPGGVAASAELACQLALACTNTEEAQAACQLPDGTSSYSRQGVTVTVQDVGSVFKDGVTGLRSVDLWLASVRYGDRHRRATATIIGPGRRSRRAVRNTGA